MIMLMAEQPWDVVEEALELLRGVATGYDAKDEILGVVFTVSSTSHGSSPGSDVNTGEILF